MSKFEPPTPRDIAANGFFSESHAKRQQIEKKLGLPLGYFETLRVDGSDWEFAIKLVVLLEAALGHVLASKLQNEAVRKHCERLGLDGKVSKLGLAEDLHVLSHIERNALTTLAIIRNSFAHKVENIAGDLATYARNLAPSDYQQKLQKLLMISNDSLDFGEVLWHPQEKAAKRFRLFMWLSADLLLQALAEQDKHAEAETQRRLYTERMAAAFRGEIPTGLGMFLGINLGGRSS